MGPDRRVGYWASPCRLRLSMLVRPGNFPVFSYSSSAFTPSWIKSAASPPSSTIKSDPPFPLSCLHHRPLLPFSYVASLVCSCRLLCRLSQASTTPLPPVVAPLFSVDISSPVVGHPTKKKGEEEEKATVGREKRESERRRKKKGRKENRRGGGERR